MAIPPPPPRIRFEVIQDEKKRGGLVVSNFKLYYQAAGLVWLSDWIKNPNEDYKIGIF